MVVSYYSVFLSSVPVFRSSFHPCGVFHLLYHSFIVSVSSLSLFVSSGISPDIPRIPNTGILSDTVAICHDTP